jgi:translation elongation factor EF-1alpha
MSFLLTGQTDSGKSTIAGHLLYLVGYFQGLPEEDKKAYRNHLSDIETSSRKSKFSVLMDLIDGEVLANKSKTQEFAMCPFQWRNRSFTLVDTPGHQLYIRSLLEALFTIKHLGILCLVVSSLPNEFAEAWEKGTTKENMLLGRSIGCKQLLILWNKTDIQQPTKAMMQQVSSYGNSLRFPKIDSLFVSGYCGDNLLKILDFVPETPPGPLVIPPLLVSETQLHIEGMFFQVKATFLVSRGFQCLLHHHTGELEVEIESLHDLTTKKPLVMVRNTNPVRVCFVLMKPITYSIGDRVILRYQKDTIGFGNIVLP